MRVGGGAQDATFKELLRRLQNLEVDPTLGHMVGTSPEFGCSADLAAAGAAAAAVQTGHFDDSPAGEVRAICQARAHIDFESVLQLLRHIRLAKVRRRAPPASSGRLCEPRPCIPPSAPRIKHF